MLQLVPAPPPPPEYCLLWADRWWPLADPWWLCMQKAEWSGWAQAIGALIALAVAIAIPAKARLDARRDAKEAVLAFMARVTLALEDLRDVCNITDWDEFTTCRHLVQDAVLAGDFLLSVPVNGKIRAQALGMRASALEVFYKSAHHTAGGNWAHWYAAIGGYAAGARVLMGKARELRA